MTPHTQLHIFTTSSAWGEGYNWAGGNKYRNLAIQVGGVSKFETIKYGHESNGTNQRKTALARPGNNLKLQTRLIVRQDAPHQQIRNCLK
jgi:hypothetical protein